MSHPIERLIRKTKVSSEIGQYGTVRLHNRIACAYEMVADVV